MADPITKTDSGLNVPDRPIIPFIEGDGIGPDVWAAASRVLDAAVAKAYGGSRQIQLNVIGKLLVKKLGAAEPDGDESEEKRAGSKGHRATPWRFERASRQGGKPVRGLHSRVRSRTLPPRWDEPCAVGDGRCRPVSGSHRTRRRAALS